MTVIIDLIAFSLQRSGGISVYWYEIIERILNESHFKPSFIEEKSININIFRKELEINENKMVPCEARLVNYLSRYRALNLKKKSESFIFHSTYYRTLNKKTKKYNNVKEVVTVHDFTYEIFNKGLKKWVHSFQKRKAIRAADVVICISENTKKDLLHFYPEFALKDIRIIYNGVSKDYYNLPVVKSVKEKELFFLFVGSRVSYKNFAFAVKVIAQTNGFNLKIVGPKLDHNEIILLDNYLSNRWEILANVNNIELNVLYNMAFALLYPSSYEGFGIPLLEAMKAGCPFIALNYSSIPEVAGDAGVLLDNLTAENFNDAVVMINKNRNKIIERGYKHVENFSWDKCYHETISIYQELNNSWNQI